MDNDNALQISGLLHFAVCPRRWALIHIEQQWADNWRTIDGEIMHERAHDESLLEKRGQLLIARGMRVFSTRLGVSGACDVVEFHADPDGVALHNRDGTWQPYPVEYKRGQPNQFGGDELQLCCQAMCLEEMLACRINEGSLYYGQTRRRKPVIFTEELRRQVDSALEQMHQYYDRGYTPRPRKNKRCRECSMAELCLPGLESVSSVSNYLATALGGKEE